MKIIFYNRKKTKNGHSIERVLDFIIGAFPKQVKFEKVNMPFEKVSFFKILINVFYSFFKKSDVNHIIGAVYYLAIFFKKKKTIITIHDCGHVNSHQMTLKRKILKFFWFDLPVKRAGFVVAISEKTKREIIELTQCNENKILVIPDPVSDTFKQSKKIFNEKVPNILQVGTAKRKGLETLIDAIKDVNCSLSIVGKLTKTQEELLKNYKISYENYFNVSDDKLIFLYQNCDIVTFVSSYEGFGMPIIEAQASGKPLITSNIEPMNQIAGEGAILVSPQNHKDLKKAILSLINNPQKRNEIIKKGLQNVAKYRASKISEAYLNLYEQILKGKN